jgi:hypothetical protein
MTDWSPTGKWRHRCEIVDGNERLILQIQETRVIDSGVYTPKRTEEHWRDAATTDLEMPRNPSSARYDAYSLRQTESDII